MLHTLAQNWWAIVLRGVFAVLFGIGTFFWPGLTLAVLVLLYGGYLFIDGILAVLWALARRREGFSWAVFLAGLASLVAGAVTLLMPGVTAIALLYVIAVWAIVRGVFEIIAAFHLRRELRNEWLLALNGVRDRALRRRPHRRAGRGGARGAVVDRHVRDRGRNPDDRPGLPTQGDEGRGRAAARLWKVVDCAPEET